MLTFRFNQSSGAVPVSETWPNGWVQTADVPVHTPGDAPYCLVDDINPTVLGASVTGTTEYDPDNDITTLVFSKVRVRLRSGDAAGQRRRGSGR